MTNLALLVLRLVVGTLLAGHGAQKLFGWFGGPGLKGTHGFMEKLGFRPGHIWGTMAALGEFCGGTLTALGLLNPLGPANITAAMMVAIRRVHWSKGVWNQGGGVEFPLTNLTAATTIALAGSGRYSLDTLLGIRVPRWLAPFLWAGPVALGVVALQRPELAEEALQRVQGMTGPTSAQPSDEPDLEIEVLPQANATKDAPSQAGI